MDSYGQYNGNYNNNPYGQQGYVNVNMQPQKKKSGPLMVILIIVFILFCCCCCCPGFAIGGMMNSISSLLGEELDMVSYNNSSICESYVPANWEDAETSEEAEIFEMIVDILGIDCNVWYNEDCETYACITSMENIDGEEIDGYYFASDGNYVDTEYITTSNGNVWICCTKLEEGTYSYECYSVNSTKNPEIIEIALFQNGNITKDEVIEFLESYDAGLYID